MSGHPIFDSFGHSSLSPLCEPQTWQGIPKYPYESNSSSDTVHHTYHRKPSASSKGSFGSATSKPLRVANENVLPSQTTSLSTLHFLGDSHPLPPPKFPLRPTSCQSSLGRDNPVSHPPGNTSPLGSEIGPLDNIDLSAECGEASRRSSAGSELDYLQNAGHGLSFEMEENETLSTKKPPPTALEEVSGRPSVVVTDTKSHPLRRLLSTLVHRHSKRKRSLSARKERWSLDDSDEEQPAEAFQPHNFRTNSHKKTSSWASSGFVTAVKSATPNLGTLSVPQSQITRRFAPLRNSKRSNKLSQVTNRDSLNGNHDSTAMIDEAAWDRAVQRRRILEEVVSSEESYIADLKVLKNVSVPSNTWTSNKA